MAHFAQKKASTAPVRRRLAEPGAQRAFRVEGTALVALHAMTSAETARATKALASEGISDVRPAKIIFSPADARKVASGGARAIEATVVPADTAGAEMFEAPGGAQDRSLEAARERGEVVKDQLLRDPDMLSTAELAKRLGMSEEGIRLKRKRHEVLGLEFARRGIRYPSWQLLGDGQLLPQLPRLFSILGNNPWTVYRFLLQRHPELGGTRALDALKHGKVEGVLAAAENTVSGGFS